MNDRKSTESTASDRNSNSNTDNVEEKDSLGSLQSFGNTDDDGETPLLSKDASARTYDTTQIGGSQATSAIVDSERGGSNRSDLSENDDDEDSEEEDKEDIMKELEKIQKLVMNVQDLEDDAKQLVNKIPQWFMITLIAFFLLTGITAMITGCLFAFDTIPEASDLLQWIVVGVALGGNCLGSLALFYSGSFKQELKELVKNIKKLQFASDKLKDNVRVLTKHRGALTKTHQVLKSEIKKLKDEIEKFEENKEIMNETAVRIGDNTKALQVENDNIKQEKESLRDEEKRYDNSMLDMDDNRKLVETYNSGAVIRVKDLSNIVETLKDTIPQLKDQVERFDLLREDVEKVSTVMGAEVDQTTTTVGEIFDEIRELTIRQERVMLYQLMERIIGTTDSRDMGHEQFKRFLLQIPLTYAGHKYDDRWFGQVAENGRIGHSDLKVMVDDITLKKVSKQVVSTQQMA